MNKKAIQLVTAMLYEDMLVESGQIRPKMCVVLISGTSSLRITKEIKEACISGEVTMPAIAAAWSELTGKPFDSSRLPVRGFGPPRREVQ